ncbi:hypothetical protein ABZ479_16550 [Streptomyces sp. NPDC005722]
MLTTCRPVAALDEDGVLITFLRSHPDKDDSAGSPAGGVPGPADDNCRAIGGDGQMTGWAPKSVEDPDTKIDVCLKAPSEETLQVVAKVLSRVLTDRR